MLIRDTGTYVEFHINAGNSSSFNHQLPWGYIINGANVGSLEHRYEAGDGWNLVGRWNVTITQTVTFKLGNTGTGGMGGPTNFSVVINRAQPPNPPTNLRATTVGSTSITLAFSYGANNGAGVTGGQISYTTNPAIVAERVVSANGGATIAGLVRGARYYFRARNVNSEGWSAWTGQVAYTLLDFPDAGAAVTLLNVRQTTVEAQFWSSPNGGAAIDAYQLLWSTNTTPAVDPFVVVGITPAVPPLKYNVTGLLPGTTYYFWSRARNSVGWGPWSPIKSIKTFAGGYVKDGAVWKQAIPYVKVAGVWRVARPWSRISGTWRESI
jgi:hypothetical protein